MVGCWFTGQGKKGDCVGKKVNGGPVGILISITILIVTICILLQYRYRRDCMVNRHLRLSHAAARKYALIMSIRFLAATDPDHGKLTKML